MALSLVLAALAYSANDHPSVSPVVLTRGDLVFYPTFAFAVATFMTAWIVGWAYESVLGEKRRSLRTIYLVFFGGFLLAGLGPVVAASALGKSTDWVNDWRTYPMMAILAWQAFKAYREAQAKAS